MKYKKVIFSIFTLLVVLQFQGTFVEAKEESKHHMKKFECEENVTLSKKQQKHLDRIFDDLSAKKIELFEAVEEYGIISKEQKEKHIHMVEKKTEKMKKMKNEWCQD